MHNARPTVRPIYSGDLWRVYHLLARFDAPQLNRALWATLFPPPWQLDTPERAVVGYGLFGEADQALGFIGVLQSQQTHSDRTYPVINLHSWYVMQEFRRFSMYLLFAALGNAQAVYLDLTPTADACFLLQKLGFRVLERSVTTYFHRPSFFSLPRQPRIFIQEARETEYSDLDVIKDHAGTQSRFAVMTLPQGQVVVVGYTVIQQVLSLSDFPYAIAATLESQAEAAASVSVPAIYVIYASDPEGFGLSLACFADWCERHYGASTVIMDTRLASDGHKQQAVIMPLTTPRLVRGEGIAERSLTNLYSELALFNTVPQGALDYGTHGKAHALQQVILTNRKRIETQAHRVDKLDAAIREAENLLNEVSCEG
jgi:hypothetical protein